MHTTYFYGKSGNLSSIRNTMKFGGCSTSNTYYPGAGDGGSTFKTANITTRLNSKGQCIGTGLKSGNHTTYFGNKGNVSSRLTAFR